MNTIIKFIYIVLGSLSVLLGVLGIFLPLLPTTVFFLLAAFFYARSSPRFYHWLLHNRWFGDYIRNYRQGRGIGRREKFITLFTLWLTIGISMLFFVQMWWIRGLLLLVAVGVTWHILALKTLQGN